MQIQNIHMIDKVLYCLYAFFTLKNCHFFPLKLSSTNSSSNKDRPLLRGSNLAFSFSLLIPNIQYQHYINIDFAFNMQ